MRRRRGGRRREERQPARKTERDVVGEGRGSLRERQIAREREKEERQPAGKTDSEGEEEGRKVGIFRSNK